MVAKDSNIIHGSNGEGSTGAVDDDSKLSVGNQSSGFLSNDTDNGS